jgi:acylphosphatase
MQKQHEVSMGRVVAKRVQVFGRVQGVFFRAFVRDEALKFGVRGFVRNLSDGSVEAHLEGDEDAVHKVVSAMRIGPPAAKVVELKEEDVEAQGFEGFTILR